MKSLKILCSSDWHLDSPFEGLRASKAELMRNEQGILGEELVALASRERVDLVLLSGDIFSSRCSCRETGEMLVRTLRGFSVPVFIAPGESDFYTPRCPYASLRLPENVHVFSDSKVEGVELNELGVKIYGAAYTENAVPSLEGFTAERKDGLRNILCIYGEHGLEMSGIDFAALGGRHGFSGLKRVGDTLYSYSGCPQGRGFSECGERGVSIAELTEDGIMIESLPLSGRQYKTLEVDVTRTEPLIALHTSVPDDTLKDIYRITLTGECAAAPDLKMLYSSLSELFFELELVDDTRLPRYIWEKAQEDSLRGDFLRKLQKRYELAEDAHEKRVIERSARWGLAALDGEKEVTQHEDK